MFVLRLNHDERKALICLLHHMSWADGSQDEVELERLRYVSEALGLALEDVISSDEVPSIEAACEVFTGEASRRVALFELLNIALADGVYHEQERQSVAQIASLMAMGIDADDVLP